MILQLQSQTLATLLAKDGGHCRHAEAIRDAVMLARDAAKSPPLPETICNDRTHLNHHTIK